MDEMENKGIPKSRILRMIGLGCFTIGILAILFALCSMQTEGAYILVVDDDASVNNGGASSNYNSTKALTDALNAAGYGGQYNITVVSETANGPTANVMSGYQMVFWVTGMDYIATITTADAENITTYLNNGGKLWLISQDYIRDVTGESGGAQVIASDGSFLKNYLHVSTAISDCHHGTPDPLKGVAGDPITNGFSFPTSPPAAYFLDTADIISPTNDADTFGIFYEDQSAMTYNAIRYGSTSSYYRLVFCAFDIAMIETLEDRTHLVMNVVMWLQGGVNHPPIAVISSPQNNNYTLSNLTVNFNGASSNDPDGDSLTYYWVSSIDGYLSNQAIFSTQLSPGDHVITLIVNDGHGGANQTSIILHVLTPGSSGEILLVDDDDSANNGGSNYNVTEKLAAALAYNGFTFDIYVVPHGAAGPSFADMQGYTFVVWATGHDYTTTLLPADENALISYLDNGGKLWLISQDYLFDCGGSSTFATNYTRIGTFTNDQQTPSTLVGVQGDELAGGAQYSWAVPDPSFQDYGDIVEPGNGAFPVFIQSGNAHNAIRYKHPNNLFRTVFFAFEFTGISSATDRADCAKRVILWLSGVNSGGQPQILVVDDDDGPNNGPGATHQDVDQYIINALNSTGQNFNVTRVAHFAEGPGFGVLNQYRLVIWITGNDTSAMALSDTDKENIIDYLNNGGMVWLIGQGILQNADTTNEFATTFHIGQIILNQGTPTTLTGNSACEVTVGLNFSTSFSQLGFLDRGDVVNPDAQAIGAFYQDATHTHYNSVLYGNETTVYKSAFFGFEFGAIASPADRAILVTKMLAWFFQGGSSNPEDPNNPPVTYTGNMTLWYDEAQGTSHILYINVTSPDYMGPATIGILYIDPFGGVHMAYGFCMVMDMSMFPPGMFPPDLFPGGGFINSATVTLDCSYGNGPYEVIATCIFILAWPPQIVDVADWIIYHNENGTNPNLFPPTAVIDSVTPNPAFVQGSLTLVGEYLDQMGTNCTSFSWYAVDIVTGVQYYIVQNGAPLEGNNINFSTTNISTLNGGTGIPVGNYSVYLVVTNQLGLTSPPIVSVPLQIIDMIPTAEIVKIFDATNPAQPPIEVANFGDPVGFKGIGKNESGVEIPMDDYVWLTDNPAPNTLIGHGSTITSSTLEGGMHTITFYVVKNGIQSLPVTKTLKVNRAPIINSWQPTSYSITTKESDPPIQFSVDAVDPDSNSLTITWTVKRATGSTPSGPGVTGASYSFKTDYISDALANALNAQGSYGAGSYKITVTVFDGHIKKIIEWNVTVQNENRAPEIKLHLPQILTTVAEGSNDIEFKISFTDKDSDDKLMNVWRYRPQGGAWIVVYQSAAPLVNQQTAPYVESTWKFPIKNNYTCAGKYEIQAEVWDVNAAGHANFVEKHVFYNYSILEITNVNRRPMLRLTPSTDIWLNETESATFSVAPAVGNQFDPDGDAVTITWYVANSSYPSGVVMKSGADSAEMRVFTFESDYTTWDQSTIWTVWVVVNDGAADNSGRNESARIKINMINKNRGPDAVVTFPDLTEYLNTDQILFDASNSTDPDGDELSYSWECNGTVISTMNTFYHTFETPGVYTVKLTVWDDPEFTVTKEFTLTIRCIDLKIDNVTYSKTKITDGSKVNLTVKVKNYGDHISIPPVRIKFQVDGVTLNWYNMTTDTDQIGPGGVKEISFWWMKPKKGLHTITVEIDDGKPNNDYKEIIKVAAKPATGASPGFEFLFVVGAICLLGLALWKRRF